MTTIAARRPRTLRALFAILALLATLTVAAPAQAAPTHRVQEQRFVKLMNRARTARGLGALQASPELTKVARRWSRRMAADGDLRHNPRVASQLPDGWTRWGENVGWASNGGGQRLAAVTRRLHRGFMGSPPHRANVLGRFNQVGVGVALDGSGTMWATMVFMHGPRPARTLSDLDGHPLRTAATTAWERGLVAACDRDRLRYCPDRPATRRVVARAVAKALQLRPSGTSHFTDVAAPSYPDALAARGVAKGCAPARFCPRHTITRAQTGSLLVRAFPALDPVDGSGFADLAADGTHSAAAYGLAAAGVTRGCTDSRFCPDYDVTRAQLAAFLVRAMDL